MKNMKWALALLVIGLMAAGCSVLSGEDGIVEGRLVDYNGIDYVYNLSLYEYQDYEFGFPVPFYDSDWGVYHEIDPGTYAFVAIPYDNSYEYPDYAYYVKYKVTAEKGGFLTDGKDKKFTITLYMTYATQTGLNITGNGGVTETQPDGSVVFRNGYITVEAIIEKLDKLPEGSVKLSVRNN